MRRSIDPATPSYALPKISQRLEEIAERERAKAAKTHWSRSVQVRPDYQPPNWEEVLGYAGSIGAFGADNVVAQADKHGWLGELRTAVGKTTESEEVQ